MPEKRCAIRKVDVIRLIAIAGLTTQLTDFATNRHE